MQALADNSLSTFAREYECRLITPETSVFREEWIKYFGDEEEEKEPPLHEMWCELAIDPVPPPSDKQVAVGLTKKDYEALCVVGKWRGKYYVLESVAERGHDPSWTVNEVFRLAMKWRIKKIRSEGQGYQRTLAWLLAQAMKSKGLYYPIEVFDDKMKKHHVITNGLKGVMSHSQLFFRREQTSLRHQVIHFPNVRNDDEIEALARGCMGLQTAAIGEGIGFLVEDEEGIPDLEYERGAP